MNEKATHPCPHCKKPAIVDKTNPYRPFCCQRCKLIDLGDWASENYKVPTEEKPPPSSETEG